MIPSSTSRALPASSANQQGSFAWMQARLIALLLRYDERSFRLFFDAHTNFEPEAATLLFYREMGILFHLRDDLFEHIVPHIVRRLSFESPRSLVSEEIPAQGQIDWQHTFDSTWAERPGEPPLRFSTRQHRRDFATPENLLAVATLLEYAADVGRLLASERLAAATHTLRHPLNEIIGRCERELSFPVFAGLRPAAQRIIEQGQSETLEARTRERLIPGNNNAYEDLLLWRVRRRHMRLLQPGAPAEPADLFGAHPRHINELYQLWIFYELVDMLHQQGTIEQLETTPGQMQCSFHQGTGEQQCRYEARYNQAIAHLPAQQDTCIAPSHLPAIRPTLYLRRIDPPPEQAWHNGLCTWHEPGVICAAWYALEPDNRPAHAPIKQLIADLTLLDEQYGILLYASPGTDDSSDTAATRWQTSTEQTLFAPAGRQAIIWPLQPASTTPGQLAHDVLSRLLADMHTLLRRPRTPRCHGIFLDTLSAVEQQALLAGETPSDDDLQELLICPKPHTSSGRMDLVSRQQHCCRDGRVCHIAGHIEARKPVRPPRTSQELLRELQHIFERPDETELDEPTISIMTSQVEALVRRFAEISGAYRRIEVYYHRLRDMGMEHTLDLLAPEQQESLALAIFLVEQLDSVGASDYSAAVIHIASVIELELQRRLLACPALTGAAFPHGRPTLGTLPFMRRNPERTEGDWARLKAYMRRHWHGRVDPNAPQVTIPFETFVQFLTDITQVRNQAAHTNPVSRNSYSKLFRITCQAGPLRIGALNVLLLAWPVA